MQNSTSEISSPLLSQATRRQLSFPERGVEIGLLDWGGNGPPLLFHHANGFCKGLWAQVADNLRHDYRVFAMDARGHGDSRFLGEARSFDWDEFALDVLAVAETLCHELDVPRLAAGVGHSFGGTSILGAASRRPELFGTTILLDPVTPPAEVTPERAIHIEGMVGRAAKRRADWPTRVEAREWFAERELFATWVPEALGLYVLDGLRERPQGGFELKCHPSVEAAVFSGGHMDLETLVSKATSPCLWIWAEKGNFPRPRHEQLVALMADARLEVASAGHLIPMEQPSWVAERIRRWLQA